MCKTQSLSQHNRPTYLGKSKTTDANGDAVFTLDPGSYRFKTTVNNTDYYSGTTNHCTIPGCTNASITVNKPVTVTVQNTAGTPQVGVVVIAFNGSTNTGITGVTNANGQAALNLQAGSYRFRTTVDGTRFWSDTVNHCTIPGCDTAQITVSGPLPVTVRDSDGTPLVNLPVYAFDGSTYVNVSAITDVNGQVFLTLVDGNYRFQTEVNGVQFWSAETNHCTLPGCTGAEIEVTKPLTVSVTDTLGTAQAGLTVRIYDGETYTGFSGVTETNGTVSLTLPAGDYRARVDYNEAKFYSSSTNHCSLPGCEQISVTVNVPVTVSVVGVDNSPFEGITVELYKDGVQQTNDDLTDENGDVLFTLNDGVYQFAANLSETRFWSETCTMPGCTEQEIVLPGGQGGIQETTISYEYDDLYRLTEANYDNGLYFHYSYDAAGNRLTETTQSRSTSYAYDIANRLSSVDGVTYTWDNNGNLLSDGTSTYTYDYNNKLVGLTQGTDVYQYAYNGLGDRVQQIVNGVTTDYVLDINTRLTQVLQDGTNTYLYGVNRVAQSTPTESEYFLPDALGSVRNLMDEIGNITLTQSYSPFGEVLNTSGDGQTDYAFTGEMYDPGTGLVYLRARYYGVSDGRFVSRDSWVGDNQIPISYNSWLYVNSNPINLIDALGLYPTCEGEGCYEPLSDSELLKLFGVGLLKEWNPENIYALSIAIDMVARKLLEKSGLSDNKYKVFREVYGITPSKHMSFTWDPKCYNCRKSQCMAFVNDLEKEFWATEYTIDENGKEEYLLIPVNGKNLPCTCTPQGAYTHGPKTYEFASMWSNVYNQTLLRNVNNVIHELGHGFNSRIDSIPANALAGYVVNIKGKDYPLVQKDRGFYKYPPEKIYVQNIAPNGSETFADMYLGWVSNVWAFNPYGDARRDFMESNMTSWIHIAMNR